MIENLGCFLRIREEVSVWMILDDGLEINEIRDMHREDAKGG